MKRLLKFLSLLFLFYVLAFFPKQTYGQACTVGSIRCLGDAECRKGPACRDWRCINPDPITGLGTCDGPTSSTTGGAGGTAEKNSVLLNTINVIYKPEKLFWKDNGEGNQPGSPNVFFPNISKSDGNYYNLNFDPNIINEDARNVEIVFLLTDNPKPGVNSKNRGEFAVCLTSDETQCDTLYGRNLKKVKLEGTNKGDNPRAGLIDPSKDPKANDEDMVNYIKHKYPDGQQPLENTIEINVCGAGESELKTDCDWSNNRRGVWFHPNSTYRVGLYQKPEGDNYWQFVGDAVFQVHRYYPNVYFTLDGVTYLIAKSYDTTYLKYTDPISKSEKIINTIGGTLTTVDATGDPTQMKDLEDIYADAAPSANYSTFKCLVQDGSPPEKGNLQKCTPEQRSNKEGVIVIDNPLKQPFRLDVLLTGRKEHSTRDYDLNKPDSDPNKDIKTDDTNDYQISLEDTGRGKNFPNKDQCVIVRGDLWEIKHYDSGVKNWMYREKQDSWHIFFQGGKPGNVADSMPAIYDGISPGDYTIDISEQVDEKRGGCTDGFTYWRIPFHVKRTTVKDAAGKRQSKYQLFIFPDEIERDPNHEDFGGSNSRFSTSPCSLMAYDDAAGNEKTTEIKNAVDQRNFLKQHKDNNPRCLKIRTGIGNLSTNPVDFLTDIFALALGIAGFGGFIMLIYGGYVLMMSQGDKTKIQNAREIITSTILGILFIVFSLVILEFIGVDVLRLPGLKRSGTVGTGTSSSSPAHNCGDKDCNLSTQTCENITDPATFATYYFCKNK